MFLHMDCCVRTLVFAENFCLFCFLMLIMAFISGAVEFKVNSIYVLGCGGASEAAIMSKNGLQ